MKKVVLITITLLIAECTYCQNSKYDGDWYYSYNGVCANQDDGPIRRGEGKDIYRIQTKEGVTTVRVKRRLPCRNEYTYWECIVTRCDEDVLEWHSETNSYTRPMDGHTIVIEYYCQLMYNHGTLQANTYLVQKELYNNQQKQTVYGEDAFTLYNDSDW